MKKVLFFAFAFVISTSIAFAQTTIKGKVFDKKTNKALAGATVSVENQPSASVTTDQHGKYSITVDATAKILVASFEGYKTQKIGIGQKKVIDIGLMPEAKKQQDAKGNIKDNPSNSKSGSK